MTPGSAANRSSIRSNIAIESAASRPFIRGDTVNVDHGVHLHSEVHACDVHQALREQARENSKTMEKPICIVANKLCGSAPCRARRASATLAP